MVALTKQTQNLENKTLVHAQTAQALSYDFCVNDYSWEQCPFQIETTNFIGNYIRNQNNPHSNTYNLGWRSHPNIGLGGNLAGGQKPDAQAQTPPRFQAQTQNILQPPAEKMSMEDMFIHFMQNQQQQLQT